VNTNQPAVCFDNVVQRFRVIRERPDTLREVFAKLYRRSTTYHAFEALKQRYVGRGEPERIQLRVIHGLAHNFGPGSGVTGSAQASIDLQIEQKTKHWFERFLCRRS